MGTVVIQKSGASSESTQEHETVAHEGVSCCSLSMQATCCEPSEKASCCGEVTSGGCDCQ